jgi:genome maintenance exonuclease 1
MYEHLNIQIPEIAIQETPDGSDQRLYRTPKGELLPSITTVLAPLKEDILKKWRERVGDTVANIESQWGRDRGSALHLALEDVLKNKSIKEHPLLIQMLVQDLMPYLKKIGKIHCQEVALFSDYFKIAGRCDCIAEYGGKLSIVDFKGSKRTKRYEWVIDYFLQTAFYAYSYWERTGYKIEQSVILIGTEQGAAQEFIELPWKWWKELKEVRKQFKNRYGI